MQEARLARLVVTEVLEVVLRLVLLSLLMAVAGDQVVQLLLLLQQGVLEVVQQVLELQVVLPLPLAVIPAQRLLVQMVQQVVAQAAMLRRS